MRSNLRRGALDRAALAEKRLTSVLRTYTVSTMRTLENKISDAGPMDMRVDPHVLTQVRANAMPGDRSLDFLANTASAGLAGIEVKNIREWIYPNREEVTELLLKCCSIDAVPVLIARRIHFSTFHVLSRCGVVMHQTYNQVLPITATTLADQVRQKDTFGFHDIRVGNDPDARLQKFIGENLPKVLPQARQSFDLYKDLLMSYGSLEIDYTEFAARSRRRSEGKNEDFDDP